MFKFAIGKHHFIAVKHKVQNGRDHCKLATCSVSPLHKVWAANRTINACEKVASD